MKQSHQGERIVLASSNAGKVREINQLLAEQEIEVVPQSEFDTPDAEETGLTFVENAILKARNAARHSGLPAIADDSGIEVDALRGAPGIYSARFSGPGCNDEDNNRKLLQELEGVGEKDRTARFQCVMVYMRHADDPTPLICQGTWRESFSPLPRVRTASATIRSSLSPKRAAPPQNWCLMKRTASAIVARHCANYCKPSPSDRFPARLLGRIRYPPPAQP